MNELLYNLEGIWPNIDHSTTYAKRCVELRLDTLEKRRTDQDMSLAYKRINEERFQGTTVLSTVGDNVWTVSYKTGLRTIKSGDPVCSEWRKHPWPSE
jgi:hypothetical protein